MENKKAKSKNKTCKNFCKKVFLPERERVEIQFSNKYNKVNRYKPIKVLRKTNKSLANLIENMYLKTCNDSYCQKSCKNSKSTPNTILTLKILKFMAALKTPP